MAIRPDREPPLHHPAAEPARSPGPWDGVRANPPHPSGGGRVAGPGGAETADTHPAGPVAPPEPPRGFLSGQRGPRTVALILTTGVIGSTLAGLLSASGVLTPSPGGGPVGPSHAIPAGTGAPKEASTPPPAASSTRSPSTPASKPRTPPPSAPRAPGVSAVPPASPPPSTPESASRQSRVADSGVLRRGDTGPAVRELQERLSRVPHVYPDGGVDGRYDAEVAEAVARFQQWYGVRGDEEGVYGDDTRRDLETHS